MKQFEKEFKTINTRNIITLYAGEGNNPGYQRPVNFARVKKMAKNFNPNLVNPLKLSFRDGSYYCFDGNHTKTLLVLRNNGKPVDVQCIVYYGMTYEDEARMFAEQNGFSARVLNHQRMKGMLEAGDEKVTSFVNELKSIGITCDFRSGGSGRNRLICYDAAYKQWQSNHDEFMKAVQVINTSWDTPTAWRGEFVNAITTLGKIYGKQFETSLAVKRFAKVSPDKVYAEAKGVMVISTTKALTQILLREYNKGRKVDGNKRLNPDLLFATENK